MDSQGYPFPSGPVFLPPFFPLKALNEQDFSGGLRNDAIAVTPTSMYSVSQVSC